MHFDLAERNDNALTRACGLTRLNINYCKLDIVIHKTAVSHQPQQRSQS